MARGRQRIRSLLIAILATASVSSAVEARADGAAQTSKSRAVDLFERSVRAYREGRFQDAIDLLLEARRLKPEPVLLYNLGRAYEAIGKPAAAADAYAEYIAEDPRAADRGAIEGRIVTLRAQAAQLERAKEPAPPAPAPAAPPPPEPAEQESPTVAPWIIAGVGVAGIGAGAIFGILAKERHSTAVSERTQAAATDDQRQATTFATASTIAFIAGGGVAAIGLTWLGVRALGSSSAARVAVRPGLGTVTVAGAF